MKRSRSPIRYVRELNEMCEDIEIFDQTFTTMKLLAIFCKVNIDDDLFEQEEEENTSTELVFEEFEEVVARIFNMAVYQPTVQAGNTANLLDQDGDGDDQETASVGSVRKTALVKRLQELSKHKSAAPAPEEAESGDMGS